ncbi:MAG: FHA domain-containing protein [Eubacteriales bacterium]
MKKFKICPVCQTKNPPSVLECTECGNDMMGVRIFDNSFVEPEKTHVPQDNDQAQPQTDLVRVCDCGYENEVSARKCVSCGEDISDIIPTPQASQNLHMGYVISSVDGKAKLKLECPCEHILGRENELASYLQPKLFVSRKHAILTVTAKGVFIQNLSKANGTYVNNQRIDDALAYMLCVGDEIGLGGFMNHEGRQEFAAYFVVGEE